MTDIVRQQFDKWTKGLDPKAKRISVCEHVRNIPYRLVPEIRNRLEGPRKVLELGCGSCTPKHFLLGAMFEMLDIPVKYVSFPFSYDQPNFSYPPDVRALAREMRTEYHLALRAYVEGSWVLVDATWDPACAAVGAPVNESWDGLSDMKLAVDPFDERVHEDPAERDAYVVQEKADWTDANKACEDRFIEAFNSWIDGVRAT